jgi:hypothetical protein
MLDEAGAVFDVAADHFAVFAIAHDRDKAGRRIKHHLGHRLFHGQVAGFQERGAHAHGVGAGHGIGRFRLQDDEAHIRSGHCGWEQNVGGVGRGAAWLEHQPAAQAVVHRVDVDQLFQNRVAGNIEHPSDHDPAGVSFTMGPIQLHDF